MLSFYAEKRLPMAYSCFALQCLSPPVSPRPSDRMGYSRDLFVLMGLVVFLWLPQACCSYAHPAHFSIADSEFQRKKDLCMENVENGLWGWRCKSSAIEKENCALKCISAECYEKIYGDDPVIRMV
ncbi:hypothetical protein KP509_22G036100 [Ceratopteris richardii]|uniref:Uncharacterized protein n=1 Tax=Ceratopteris richardii TaxID=49495 RepID=A0A8T2S502_CERRI|nr:hypothetical protein KP509_22G036100 [Ceratopteris richardii]